MSPVQCAEEASYSRGKYTSSKTSKVVKFVFFKLYDIHVTEPMIGMWTDIGQEAETLSESVNVVGKVGQLV